MHSMLLCLFSMQCMHYMRARACDACIVCMIRESTLPYLLSQVKSVVLLVARVFDEFV